MTREEAIYELQDILGELRNTVEVTNELRDACKMAIQALEQEPRKGHWIDSSNGWMCSKCNKDNTFDTNYCPNCGAKMVEPQESEEV